MKTKPQTSEHENYTQNEWRSKLHSKRVKMRVSEWRTPFIVIAVFETVTVFLIFILVEEDDQDERFSAM